MKNNKRLLLETGTVQTRIKVTAGADKYSIYSQEHLIADLTSCDSGIDDKEIETMDRVTTTVKGDLVFSLISGKATLVSQRHEGYLLTQNFVRISLPEDIDSAYLVYLLNEKKTIKHFFQKEMQGSVINKYSIKMLESLPLDNLPELAKQKIIGSVYLNRLKLETLKQKRLSNERLLILSQLEEIDE